MSEKQPKLKFEEEKERTATRSPPKKSKVEQSVPKSRKLKTGCRQSCGEIPASAFWQSRNNPG